jgi:uncharacterized protein YkwD
MPRHPAQILLASLLVLFVGLTVYGFTLNRNKLSPLGKIPVRNYQPPLVTLPGALDMRGREVAVLGWDTEEMKEEDFIALVNQERAAHGSPLLSRNAKLSEAARMRATTILKHQNFSHQDPYDHIQLDTVLPKVNYAFSYASENIGLAQATLPEILKGFSYSPPHYKNLLDPNLQETGVGIEKGTFGGNYVVILVEIFGSPASPESYLGYSPADITTVQDLLKGVNDEIGRTQTFLSANADSSYYRGWLTVEKEQKDRLTQVYSRMLAGLPYEKKQYDLIAEYNSGWEKAPQ